MAEKKDPEAIRKIYVESEKHVTVKALAKEHKFNLNLLQKRCKVEGWVAQRADFQARIKARAEELTIEKIAARKAVTLEELNDEASARTRRLIALNERKLDEAMRTRTVLNAQGEEVQETYFDMVPRDLRAIQQNIIDAHHELRLYANFEPDKPIAVKDDNSKDREFLDALFAPILGALTGGMASE